MNANADASDLLRIIQRIRAGFINAREVARLEAFVKAALEAGAA